ncbi:MAG: hypothetical protein CME35_14650 [Gramella sp.]|nr:hypothetical protein [Christiangramia sp.]
MRCPKCHYVGFGSAERCRHCGYDLSLKAASLTESDPVIRSDLKSGELAELPLHLEHQVKSGTSRFKAEPEEDLSNLELPLFLEYPTDGAPNSEALDRGVRESIASGVERSSMTASSRSHRLCAAVLDIVLMVCINAVVVYMTLKLSGLAFTEWLNLPVAPLAGFLFLLTGGYVVAFTVAGGQTLGKMAFGIKVICVDGNSVGFGTGLLRAAAYLISVLPCGIGFVVGLFDQHDRTLHDRVAATRVVKSS